MRERKPLKPTIVLARATTPEGHTLTLSQHDRDFYISLNQRQLMTSREYESELALARLGCHGLQGRSNPQVLIGGLGMGFTLRQTLELLPGKAKVTVAELIPEVVAWNQEFLSELTRHALEDPRVTVNCCDVRDIIYRSRGLFDVILLDVDNGPSSMTQSDNAELYEPIGLHSMMGALKEHGCLAIWSVNGTLRGPRRR